MPDTINAGGEVLRKSLICAVDVSDGGSGTPEWEIQGWKVEDSGIDFNPDSETMRDVLGLTHTTVNGFEESQSFDPNTLRTGAKLSEKLLKLWRDGEHQAFSEFKVLTIYGFMGTEGSFEADMWSACTIFPDSLGGSSRVDMPFTINYGGEKQRGSVDKLTNGMIFTQSPGA